MTTTLHTEPSTHEALARRRWLTAPGPARLSVLIRTGLAGIIVLRLVFRDWWLLSTTPPALFDKVFAVSWMAGPPSRGLVTGLWIVALVGAVACVFRVRAHLSFVVAWLAFVQLTAMWSSSGKVMHNDILLVWACVPFLFAAAPHRDEVDTIDERWGWAPRSSMTVVAAVYFFAGIQKLNHSGLAWISADNIAWVVRQGGGPLGEAANRSIASVTPLMFVAAVTTMIFEVGAPVLLAWRWTRGVFVVLAGSFHLMIYFTIGLDYYGWILTLIVVILPQAALPRLITAPLGRRIGNDRLPPNWRPPDRATTSRSTPETSTTS